MRPAIGLVGAVALAACAPSPTPASMTAYSIEGDWRVAKLNGVPMTGMRSDARFAKGALNIAFGCNTLRGGYRLEADRLIPVYPLGTTEMACGAVGDGPDPMVLEQRGFAIAGKPMLISFQGPERVRLSNEAGTIDLSR